MEKKTSEGKEGVTMNSKAQLIIVFLIGFLLGLLIGPTFTGDNATPEVIEGDEKTVVEEGGGDKMTDDKMSEGGVATKATGEVVVNDQLAGDRVVVDSVSVSKEAWVVVHESKDGVPANALGATRVDAGEHAVKSIELLRDTETGAEYFVILYSEDGDGEFNISLDTPLLGEDDGFISTSFNTIQVDRRN